LLATAKSPEAAALVTARLELLMFATVTLITGLAIPTPCVGKLSTAGEMLIGKEGSENFARNASMDPPLAVVSFGSGGTVQANRNAGYSHYNALQVRFQRRMSRGLQALVSYNFAESNDLGSTDADGVRAASATGEVLPLLTPSDFDVRNSLAGAVRDPPWGRTGTAILKGWAVDGLLRVTSAPPINVTVGEFRQYLGT
jgi:hypothetical protein